MIDPKVIKTYNLKSYTMSACKDMYIKLSREYVSHDAIAEVLSWWRDQPEKLNEAWWALNYHSDELDGKRKLRAIIEETLHSLVKEADEKLIVEVAASKTGPNTEATE